jgi:hypothetical protein
MAIMPLEPGQFAARKILFGYLGKAGHRTWLCRQCAEEPDLWPRIVEATDGSEWEHDDFCPICGQHLVLCKYIARGETCPQGCWSDEAVYINGHVVEGYPIQGRAWQMLPGGYWPRFVPTVMYYPDIRLERRMSGTEEVDRSSWLYISGEITVLKDAFELIYALDAAYGIPELRVTPSSEPIRVIVDEPVLGPELLERVQDYARAFLVGLHWQRRI